MTEDETVGWHHLLNGHEFEQPPGDSEGQGSLACCSPFGSQESVTTERLEAFKVHGCAFSLLGSKRYTVTDGAMDKCSNTGPYPGCFFCLGGQ